MIQTPILNLHNDILDNVRYAVNIQSAIMPSEKKLQDICPNSFSIYRPQRLVSGDFYWIEKYDSKLTIVFGDSTGHGVSASYISIIVLSALEVLKQNRNNIEDPKEVLKYLNNHLYSVLKKDIDSNLFDAAEIASCTIDYKAETLTYASAGINILTSKKGETYKLPKNKTAVGTYENSNFNIDKYVHKLNPNERIFLMSDGFQDQHGGMNNKKLGSKKLHSLISETSGLSATYQKSIIETFLNNWQGKNDQTDDIALIGITMPNK